MKAVERYQKIQEQVVRATDRVDRDRASVRLMVVSKTWRADDIEPIANAGHLVYGENRVLEAIDKISLLPSQLEWHLIGHLQKNKVRKALPAFHTIHSVDSLELAQRIDQIALDLGLKSRVLLQVNIGNEPSLRGHYPNILFCQMLQTLLNVAHQVIISAPTATNRHVAHIRH
mgnify:CR=1 FL=1